ncbi:zinc finger MYM-type 1-like [Pelobates cultripes]|uniref:Zinc finger MYM-type 1-like n=1 Tax=Pelobates cultripes TaxID=61616 RepID=A0AAD1WJ23_PELCU|nr:zinc finger MYM-type 1-like [Pelobates cultripes]
MKRNRPSGSPQRKIKKAKEKSAEAMSGSILKYVAPSTSTAVGESAEDIQSVESRGEMPEVSSQEASYVKAQELEKIILSSSGESDVDEGDASRSLHQQDSDDDDEEEEEETVRLSVYSDVSVWPVPVPDVLRVDLIKRGSEPFQNRDGPFSPVERQGEKSKGKSRQLTTAWFYKALPNGEKILRTWMLYLPSKQSLFCFFCRLFAVDDKNKLICLLGNHVKDKIVADFKKAKYFWILFDSTPDVSHTDQMCEVIRYVHIEGDHVEVKESFLGFFPVAEKTAAELTENILQHLEEDGLHISLCRGQGYDNAATMAGIHGGVQAKIKEINPKALFMPCANHSLNLFGLHSFGSVVSCVTFFGTLERVYSFFSVSTHRWELLMENVGVTVKRLSQTRWSAHYDAVKPVRANFEKLTSALEKFCNPKENVATRGSAQMLQSAVCDFSFLCYLSFWCEVLEEVNITQKYLQTVGLTLEKCIVKLQGLKAFLADQRSEIVEKAICYATTTCKEMDISKERRGRVKLRKTMPGEKAKDAGLTLPEEMKRAMFECLDRFHHALEICSQAIEKIISMFAVIQPSSLVVATEKDIHNYIPKLTDIFDEFSNGDIFREIERLRRHLEAAKISVEEAKKWMALQFIVKWDYCESLPYLSLCLRFFLTLCVSIASCEKFFQIKIDKKFLSLNHE